MAESLVGTGTSLHKAINPAIVVEPVETSFHLPALARVAGLQTFRGNKGSTVVRASRDARMNVPREEMATEGIAVVPLVRSEAHGLSDRDIINRTQRKVLIIPVGSPADNRKEVPLPVNDNTPFQPIDTMFSRVSAVFLAPFFDFTTEASR